MGVSLETWLQAMYGLTVTGRGPDDFPLFAKQDNFQLHFDLGTALQYMEDRDPTEAAADFLRLRGGREHVRDLLITVGMRLVWVTAERPNPRFESFFRSLFLLVLAGDVPAIFIREVVTLFARSHISITKVPIPEILAAIDLRRSSPGVNADYERPILETLSRSLTAVSPEEIKEGLGLLRRREEEKSRQYTEEFSRNLPPNHGVAGGYLSSPNDERLTDRIEDYAWRDTPRHALLRAYLEEVAARLPKEAVAKMEKLPAGQKLSRAMAADPGGFISDSADLYVWMLSQMFPHNQITAMLQVLETLSRTADLSLQEGIDLLARVSQYHTEWWSRYDRYFPNLMLETIVQRLLAAHPRDRRLAAALDELEGKLFLKPRLVKRLQRIRQGLPPAEETMEKSALVGRAVWSDALLKELREMPADRRLVWQPLIDHCGRASSSQPSGKWLKQARELAGRIGDDEVKRRLSAWFESEAQNPLPNYLSNVANYGLEYQPTLIMEMVDRFARTTAPAGVFERFRQIFSSLAQQTRSTLADRNANFQFWDERDEEQKRETNVLVGLIWLAASYDDDGLAAAIGDLGVSCFKKIPDIGPRFSRAGNACIYGLSVMPTRRAAAELARIQVRAQWPSVQKLIEKALNRAAEKAGLTREDLEEISVPDFGLDERGELTRASGDYAATLRVRGVDVEIEWTAGGKRVKAPPAGLKQSDPALVKEVKAAAAEIAKMLPAQRERIERLFLSGRALPLPDFRARYLDHPLIGDLARRLIWNFDSGGRRATAFFLDGGFVDAAGAAFTLDPAASVSLWHPHGAGVDEVMAWRRFLEDRGLTQPFKQAHREVYFITDAERDAVDHSLRFAGHLVRQHQLQALFRAQGWSYKLQGGFDGWNEPTLILPRHGLKAFFTVENQEGGAGPESESGISLLVTTDRLRFEGSRGETVALADVPPLVFSEVMRDLDLFTSVCSIGLDPTWADHGHPDTLGYWQTFAQGELTEQAKTRADLLSRLIPRIPLLRERATLEDRHLLVRGDRDSYRIHLGSAAVQRVSNSSHLCIVPSGKGRAPGEIRLPFEGDGILTLIISKALLLAQDTKITNPSIKQQLN